MTLPISPGVLRRRRELREGFRSDHPLPRFVIVPNFLRANVLSDAMTACRNGRYATFCSFSRSARMTNIRDEFCEPNERFVYLAVHQRPTRALPGILQLRRMFERRETVAALSELTGIALTRLIKPGALTCWGPGSFLKGHTDSVPGSQARLVLSLSLTGRWHRSYGGATVFSWSGMNRAVRLWPRRNTAVLFAPFPGSFHWVEQISENAPPRRRFTWTAFFA